MHGATDAARAAADIVLTEEGLSVIIDAIFESRKIFQRMRNYIIYRIACTLQVWGGSGREGPACPALTCQVHRVHAAGMGGRGGCRLS